MTTDSATADSAISTPWNANAFMLKVARLASTKFRVSRSDVLCRLLSASCLNVFYQPLMIILNSHSAFTWGHDAGKGFRWDLDYAFRRHVSSSSRRCIPRRQQPSLRCFPACLLRRDNTAGMPVTSRPPLYFLFMKHQGYVSAELWWPPILRDGQPALNGGRRVPCYGRQCKSHSRNATGPTLKPLS